MKELRSALPTVVLAKELRNEGIEECIAIRSASEGGVNKIQTMLKSISTLLIRDLTKLRSEVEIYSDERDLWIVTNEISNSAGTLCLHLCGNLRHFIGAKLGNGDYIRDRPAEFNSRDVPRTELLKIIDMTIDEVASTLDAIDHVRLSEPFPEVVFGYEMTTEFFLIHLHGHLNYHLGQINYHRRLLT